MFQGEGLREDLTESDPQKDGLAAKKVKPLFPEAQRTADIVNHYIRRATEVLKPLRPANTILLRGFSKVPELPTLSDRFKLRAAAIATYPMYRGLARLVGMDVLETGESLKDEVETLKRSFADYDFFISISRKRMQPEKTGILRRR